ncbi:MAG TPA: amino acid adenylation domain-containing protein [Herpetosiphonaceae bacterium]
MSTPDTLSDRPDLSPAKRALLEKWKRGQFKPTEQTEQIPRRAEQGPAPVSFTQQRLWFLDQLVPDSPAYTICFAIRLEGQLDQAALLRSLNEIVRRHEALRTTFTQATDGQPLQVIAPALVLDVPIEDLTGLLDESREEAIERVIDAEARQPFDLVAGPLIRARLLRLSDQEHVFLLALHHIISDAWSVTIFIQELVSLYATFSGNGAANGNGKQLAELAIQYADYAVWQRQSVRDEMLERHLDYWQRQLAPNGNRTPTVLELPIDYPRPPIQTFRGAMQRFSLPAELTQALRTLSRQEDATLFMTLLAAFQTLLYRYTGQQEILVGSPIAGRPRPELESLIGFFANTILLRGDLSGNPGFRELLKRVRETTLGAYTHQELPFEQIVEVLQPERDMSRNPLFQVMFVLQNAPMPSVQLPSLRVSTIPTNNGTAKFDLWLSITEDSDSLFGQLEYNTDLFEAATIERLIGHFQVLLQGIVAQPELPITRLPLLTEAEQQQLTGWNATATDYALDRPLHTLIEAQVERTPDAVALVFEQASLSYAELNARANQLAHHLIALELQPETLVGICVERSLELVIGLLGILKAGCAYVPIDPSYPRERLQFLIQDAQVPVLLTQAHIVEQLPEHGANVICLDTSWPTIAQQPTSNPASAVTPDNLAYMIYTSGSTGLPKGAMVPHRGIVNRLLWMQETYGLTADDRVVQKTPFSFDVSVWEFFWPLLTGARLVIARPDGHKDPAYLIELINQQQITTIHFVPSMLQAFLDVLGFATCDSLRRVICSGEALSLELQQRFFAYLDADLHNLYGPTEASVDVTFWPCRRDSRRRTVPIGYPVANTQIHVLDPQLNPVPVGVPGELHIGGVQLGRGYLHRPALTAEKFIPDPFSSAANARLYKTGDLVRYAPDGAIEYLGRIDQQIKLRGLRIELGEIEETLRQHTAVHDAIALAREDNPGHKRLVAYILPDSSAYDLVTAEDSLPDEQVSTWQNVFDTTYAESTDVDTTFNIVGWNSSYTGEALPASAMREWVDQTVERIQALRPRRVLEIGVGTGLLLFRIAPGCERYVGTDISAVALQALQANVQAQGLANVELAQRPADDLGGFAEQSFDIVVINSVVQYFPGVDYLLGMLESAARLVAPGGAIFVGDVRNRRLLEAFHTTVELHRAADDHTSEQIRQRARHGLAQEHELALDPAFFTALAEHLPQIGDVTVQLKRGHDHNELTQFRYDVVLHIGAQPVIADVSWRDWQQEPIEMAALRQELAADAPELVAIANVPNARIESELRALSLLESSACPPTAAELRALLASSQSSGVDPEDFWGLQNELPYTVEIGWAGANAGYDVVLRRSSAARVRLAPATPQPKRQPWSAYANNPLQGKLAQQLTPLLRSYLQERLPEYMIPSAFVLIDEIPLTPNGKLNREALPPPAVLDLADDFVAPESPIEQTLAEIWAQVLHIEQVGIHNNFFALGGDSILSLQIIARAQQAGLRITPKQMFQYQTIAELAAVVTPIVPASSEQEIVTGAVPLTPMQHVLLDQRLAPATNQVFQLEVPADLSATWLQAAVAHVLQHHDALRLRITSNAADRQQQIAEPDPATPFKQVDLAALPPDEQLAAITATIGDAANSLNLSSGPVFSAVYVDLGPQLPGRLILVSHPLVLDQRSWPIIVADLWTAYEQLAGGAAVKLPLKTTSFKRWAEQLAAYAHEPALSNELDYWLKPGRVQLARLDEQQATNPGERSRQIVHSRLGVEETRALLHDAQRPYRTQVDELLLAALAQGFAAWSGTPALLVDLERDARGALADLDPLRTAGCFTSRFPLLLDLGAAPSDEPSTAIKTIKEAVRSIPRQGIGYGALRYLSDDPAIAEQLRALPQSQIRFHYHDAAKQALPESLPLKPIADAQATTSPYLLDLGVSIAGDQLHLAWSYDEQSLPAQTVEQLAERYLAALQTLITHCLAPDAGGFTPSDFPLAQLSQQQLDQIIAAKGAVEDIYPLGVAQEHMVRRYLSHPEPALYLVYKMFILESLNVPAFMRSWQQIIDRHPVLRTSFVWEGVEQPLQVVHATARLRIEQQDWRGLSPTEQQQNLAAYVESIRQAGFDLSIAPQTRMALFQISEESYYFYWSFNYMLQDGWSFPVLVKDFFDHYEANCQGQQLERRPTQPYRAMIEYLEQQDLTEAEAFWRKTLQGITGPTPLVARTPGNRPEFPGTYRRQNMFVPAATNSALRALAQQQQMTLSTLVQGAWALIHSAYTGQDDVVFGYAASGRSAPLPDIEYMIGPFNSFLPMRVRVDPDMPLLDWLQEFQLNQVEQRQYENSPLVKIKAWSEIPDDLPLFESYLTFENFPLETTLVERGINWMRPAGGETQTEHELRVTVWPIQSLSFHMSYQGRSFSDAAMQRMLKDIQTLLEGMVARPEQRLGELLQSIATE